MKPEDLKRLAEDCTDVAYRNWDGYVEVSQNENGVLIFRSYNEDGEEEGWLEASPHLEPGIKALYEIRLADTMSNEPPILMQLIPLALVGLLGL